MPKNIGSNALQSVSHDPTMTLNDFMDLRERQQATEGAIDVLKGLIRKMMPRGKSKTDLEGFRNHQKGKFIVTIVPRDLRQPDNERTIDLLRRKGIQSAKVDGVMRPTIKVVEQFDHDALAVLIEAGAITNDELADILVGTVTDYPKVTFKPNA